MNDPGDLSIDTTRHKRIEQALRDVALGVSGATGQDIFQSITRYLATCVGVDFAFIGKLIKGPPARIQTLAVYNDGQCIDNIQYDLAGTPCQRVVGHIFRFIPRDICSEYPGDNMLSRMAFEGYAGYPLFDSQGAELGLIAVLHRSELDNPDFIEAVLKIFSVRAASELERLRVEDALHVSEELYRSIFNASVDGLLLCGPDGKIVDSNPAFCDMLGFSHGQLQGMDPERLTPAGSEAAYRSFVETASAGKTFHAETWALHRDGSSVAVEVHGVQVQYRDRPHLLAIVRDITERRQAEDGRSRLEAQLRQAQKMEAIGHLTGGIAHDFNNILTGVMGYIVLAQERNETLGDERLGRYLERAQRSGQRARDLIQQMLTFSRGQRGEPRALQVAPLIGETVKLLAATLPSSLEISTYLDADVPAVMLDPVQLEQVLMNLCINARDAMQGSGRIEVRLSHASRHGQSCAGCRQPVSGHYLEIAVSDTGAGITAEVLERMFEPFYSTKEVGKGSGMGLAMVHGIVHEHGGHVLVESTPGRGTCFRVLFPALGEDSGAAVSDTPCDGERNPAPALSGRILVVDDDEAASEFMGDLLETWGIEATVLRDSVAALELFRHQPQAFDLAILDQTMPHMKGLELARHLHALTPGLPVVLYSGYSESITQEGMDGAGVTARIQKPVDTAELRALVRRLLTPSG